MTVASEFYTQRVMAMGDDDPVNVFIVKELVDSLLGDVRHALDNLMADGHGCACDVVVTGVTDTSECVIHNQATHDRAVVNRVYDVLQRWEMATTPPMPPLSLVDQLHQLADYAGGECGKRWGMGLRAGTARAEQAGQAAEARGEYRAYKDISDRLTALLDRYPAAEQTEGGDA